MSLTLRIILLVGSFVSFIFCVRKIQQAKLKVENSITWMLGSFLLVLMSVFEGVVNWVASTLGFMESANFVFFVIIAFLLLQVFLDNLKLAELNEKIKNLDHYIGLKENRDAKKEADKK